MVSFRKLHLFYIVVFFTAKICHAQKPLELRTNKLSYEEMYSIYLSDSEKYQNEVFFRHVDKAKEEKDTLQWAQAYRMRAWDSELHEGLKYLDSAIRITQRIKSKNEEEIDNSLGLIYLTRSNLYYINDKNSKAAEETIKSFNLAKKVKNHELVSACLGGMAEIKTFFGQENEGLLLAKMNLEYSEKHKTAIPGYPNHHAECLERVARVYVHLRETDSAQIYIQKSLETASKIGNDSLKVELKILSAKSEFYGNRYTNARDTLLKYCNSAKELWSADDLYYLGRIEGSLGNHNLKIQYFQLVDSILRTQNYPIRDNSNKVYQFLLKDAIENNDTQKEQEYLERLVHYDSLLTDTQERLRKITLTQFDLPLEEEEKQVLNEAITSKQRFLNILYVASGLLLIGLLGYYLKYRETKKRLDYALTNTIKVEKPSKPNTMDLAIDKSNEEVLLKILNRLDSWETEKGFLDGSLSQQSLAKLLNTNTSYLSQTINLYKGQNFSNYLKDLRVTYAINHLKENPVLAKNKSMIQLAELFGFSSTTVFTKAFKRKVGLTPGVFLKEILKDSKTRF